MKSAERIAGLGLGELVPKRFVPFERARSRRFGFCHRFAANARARSGDAIGVPSRVAARRRRSRAAAKRSRRARRSRWRELLRDGAHGIVNFPVQDTIYPHGWEAPWANWSYAWDAALTVDLRASPRYAPTFAFGDIVRRYGALLAKTHVAADASIVWPRESVCTRESEQRRFWRRLPARRLRCSARATRAG